MLPNFPSALSLLALLLTPLSQTANAAPAPAPAPAPQDSPKPCNPDPCGTLPVFIGWVPYCHQGALYCTVGPGMVTVSVGRCEEWCQPEPPKPQCPPPRPPPAENCRSDPCTGVPLNGWERVEGWEPYCYQERMFRLICEDVVNAETGEMYARTARRRVIQVSTTSVITSACDGANS
ncbi:hypothetical protein VTJ49DRAFT_5158 [Mycothermus thermophilus]|uniref:Uncharacterized protein n=1 Tax=Humicola insolens TaxID=85995 RepID=A0ABR3V3U0_HUMIN